MTKMNKYEILILIKYMKKGIQKLEEELLTIEAIENKDINM